MKKGSHGGKAGEIFWNISWSIIEWHYQSILHTKVMPFEAPHVFSISRCRLTAREGVAGLMFRQLFPSIPSSIIDDGINDEDADLLVRVRGLLGPLVLPPLPPPFLPLPLPLSPSFRRCNCNPFDITSSIISSFNTISGMCARRFSSLIRFSSRIFSMENLDHVLINVPVADGGLWGECRRVCCEEVSEGL